MNINKYSTKLLAIAATASALLLSPAATFAATDHVVISQVQISGSVADDEFVELYNPTDTTVDLTGWDLKRKTESGETESSLDTNIDLSIPPHSYLLIAPAQYTGSVAKDAEYSTLSRIAANNTVLLYDNESNLVDKVGFGTATDKEVAAVENPSASGSVQRKLDETNGNGQDTDNNFDDFVLLENSDPHNSLSQIASPSPSPSPTVTPGPTETPSPTPTEAPTPTETPVPSATPTATPEPTQTPGPTQTPTPQPTKTPGEVLGDRDYHHECRSDSRYEEDHNDYSDRTSHYTRFSSFRNFSWRNFRARYRDLGYSYSHRLSHPFRF